MSELSYKIKFTDESKDPIVIEPNTKNYDTPLVLFGRGTLNWGQEFNSNLVRILENFCNEYLPGYAGQVLEGQLWYNSDTKQLNLCTASTKGESTTTGNKDAILEWTPLTNIPSPDLIGIVTDSILEKSLADYIPLSGNSTNMTGSLLVETLEVFSNPLAVATKKYVDSLVCACSGESEALLDNYVSVSGAETNTNITLIDNTASTSYAVQKKYVDLKRKLTRVGAPNLDITNASQFISGVQMTSASEANVTYVNYNGYIVIPGTTTTGNIVCDCTLPFALESDYYVTVASTVTNGKDKPGTTDTGTAGDAYVEVISATLFKIKCVAKTYDMTVYVSVNGIKSA